MKKIPALLALTIFYINLAAQNVGIGITNPLAKLHINGSLKVTADYITAVNAPTPAQTYTIANATLTNILSTDSVARVYDPGGPNADYSPGTNADFYVNPGSSNKNYLEMLIESIDLGTGDSLLIYDGSSSSDNLIYKAGNGFSGTNISVSLLSGTAYCKLKANNNASVGTGFSILIKRRFFNTNTPETPVSAGTGLFFYPENGAFRAGGVSGSSLGEYSTAMGYNSIASGPRSTAIGDYTTASNYFCTAIGSGCIASGFNAVAMGNMTNASGNYSTAIGILNFASGESAFATGAFTNASGNNSTALGSGADATGDNSTAMGNNTTSQGNNSTAMGCNTKASGATSTAMGYTSEATGDYSTAMGYSTLASGVRSTAIGHSTEASAEKSIAIGSNTTASGLRSTAMGNYVTAGGEGSFAIGDNSTTTTVNFAVDNRMTMRFDGGTAFIQTPPVPQVQ